MVVWDAAVYSRFAHERQLPIPALLTALPDDLVPTSIVDLGCGSGQLTTALAMRFPLANIVGVDASADMLAKAPTFPQIRWEQGDLASWRSSEPVDLVASNAALHWLDDPLAALPALADALAPGGVLALQVPRNTHAPSHQLVEAVGRAGPWSGALAHVHPPAPVPPPEAWSRALAGLGLRAEVWETTWQHRLTGDRPVLHWLMGTTLRPWLTVLGSAEAQSLLDALGAALDEAYPKEPDGSTLFAFRRLFAVARKP